MSNQCDRRPTSSRHRALVWRAWLATALVVVVGTTAVSALWHAGHETDQDCAVCKLRHQPLADLAGDMRVTRTDTPDPSTEAFLIWIPADTTSPIPARAPPLT